MENFAGYGNPKAGLWFVGMEEHGHGTVYDLSKRVETWAKLGQNKLEGLGTFHLEAYPGHPGFHEPIRVQKTWGQLIRLLLAWRREKVTDDRIKEVQKSDWGTISGDTALVELLPLPARRIRDWRYADSAPDLPELMSRSVYREKWEPKRIDLLKQCIDEAKPKAVVFYGKRFEKVGEPIAETTFDQDEFDGIPFWIGRRGETRFVIARHPAAHKMTKSYWEHIGANIRES